MPLDASNFSVQGTINGFAGWTETGERDPGRFIPYYDNIEHDVILLKDGSVMSIIAFDGFNFHLADNASRNGFERRHFAFLQILADPHTEVSEHLVCHSDITEFNGADGGSPYWNEVKQRYHSRALRGLKTYQWYLCIIVRPRLSINRITDKARDIFGAGQSLAAPRVDSRDLRRLLAKTRTAMAALRRHNPTRLGLLPSGHSAMGEALGRILTTRRLAVPLVQPAGSFGLSLYRERVTHGPLGFLIDSGGGRSRASVGRMICFNAYPKQTRVGMFDKILSDVEELDGCRWVMSNSLRPLSRAQSTDRLELTLARMEKSEARSKSDMDDLEDALDEIASGKDVRANHSWNFAVHADSMEQLDQYSSTIMDIIASAGCSPTTPGKANEAAYWSQLPGNMKFCPAPAVVSIKCITNLSGLDGFPSGETNTQNTHWNAPLLRYKTSGGSAYDNPMFDGRLGHALYCGPSDSGKTSCLGMNATAATAIVGDKGTILIIDKDESNKLTIANNGGGYVKLSRGDNEKGSGAAPLQRLQNTPNDRAVMADLIYGMILADGGQPISERAKARIGQGIAFVMRQEPHKRSLGAVHAWIPPASLDPSDSANRFKPWCRGERIGWAFDSLRDDLNFDRRMAGVDITALIEDAAVLPVMAAYIVHLAGKVMDGRRFIFIVEELKFLLPKSEFSKRFEDIILTGRKKNVAFWAAIQQPESLLTHPLGPALLGQMRIRYLFKNELANRAAYCGGGEYGDGLHCTPQEYEQVRSGMTAGAWSVLIQRPGKSVLCRFDLSSMPEDLAIYSATPQRVKLWDSIAETRQEFISRLEETKA